MEARNFSIEEEEEDEKRNKLLNQTNTFFRPKNLHSRGRFPFYFISFSWDRKYRPLWKQRIESETCNMQDFYLQIVTELRTKRKSLRINYFS